jgi:ATP-dependent DNA helicase RecQ
MTLNPYQAWIVSRLLTTSHEDGLHGQIILLPTGFGKSLCFTAPIQSLPGITLVLFPLRALVKDQGRRARELNLDPLLVLGSGGWMLQVSSWLRRNSSRGLVYATPEALLSPPGRSLLNKIQIHHFVIDEAHTFHDWGRSFRPKLRSIPDLLREIRPKALSLLTATATAKVLEDLISSFGEERNMEITRLSPYRSNQAFFLKRSTLPYSDLKKLLKNEPVATLIFVSSRRKAKALAQDLWADLYPRKILYYHAGMAQEDRSRIEDEFMNSPKAVLLATKAYGMGMDKGNIRLTVHFDPPDSIPELVQESGRGGRDGSPFRSILLRRRRLPPALRSIEEEKCCRMFPLMQPFGATLIPCGKCDLCLSRNWSRGDKITPQGKKSVLWDRITCFFREITHRFMASLAPKKPKPGVKMGLSPEKRLNERYK